MESIRDPWVFRVFVVPLAPRPGWFTTDRAFSPKRRRCHGWQRDDQQGVGVVGCSIFSKGSKVWQQKKDVVKHQKTKGVMCMTWNIVYFVWYDFITDLWYNSMIFTYIDICTTIYSYKIYTNIWHPALCFLSNAPFLPSHLLQRHLWTPGGTFLRQVPPRGVNPPKKAVTKISPLKLIFVGTFPQGLKSCRDLV